MPGEGFGIKDINNVGTLILSARFSSRPSASSVSIRSSRSGRSTFAVELTGGSYTASRRTACGSDRFDHRCDVLLLTSDGVLGTVAAGTAVAPIHRMDSGVRFEEGQ